MVQISGLDENVKKYTLSFSTGIIHFPEWNHLFKLFDIIGLQ